ncbi:hypothetical protein SAMN04488029_3406 [Reichenbachiella faecimaris]|uniref:DUF1440 domain-containing protein n=1 Tax=Reichenbachiella faecimaris TaxID=692418 RepID=A0A1W2GN44_REIFA|nr:hypothetical protein [Reichenbachiella faecimaris]SMD37676.1 hypothetical protein SAMN04488029_3406 [Reichenbachiella faecimaris]
MKTKIILLAGLLVGTLDILAAFIDFYIVIGNDPTGVLRYIASGVFGSAAFTGGSVMIVWGLFFHYVLAYSFTILFFWLHKKVTLVSTYPITTAVIYGVFMWIITVLVIVPMSETPPIPFNFWTAIKAVLILIFMISLPLTFIVKKKTYEIH